jgi:hypothetical protein
LDARELFSKILAKQINNFGSPTFFTLPRQDLFADVPVEENQFLVYGDCCPDLRRANLILQAPSLKPSLPDCWERLTIERPAKSLSICWTYTSPRRLNSSLTAARRQRRRNLKRSPISP